MRLLAKVAASFVVASGMKRPSRSRRRLMSDAAREHADRMFQQSENKNPGSMFKAYQQDKNAPFCVDNDLIGYLGQLYEEHEGATTASAKEATPPPKGSLFSRDISEDSTPPPVPDVPGAPESGASPFGRYSSNLGMLPTTAPQKPPSDNKVINRKRVNRFIAENGLVSVERFSTDFENITSVAKSYYEKLYKFVEMYFKYHGKDWKEGNLTNSEIANEYQKFVTAVKKLGGEFAREENIPNHEKINKYVAGLQQGFELQLELQLEYDGYLTEYLNGDGKQRYDNGELSLGVESLGIDFYTWIIDNKYKGRTYDVYDENAIIRNHALRAVNRYAENLESSEASQNPPWLS